MMMNLGLAEISKLIGNGLGGATFDAIALGTGNTAVAANQTALVAEISTNAGNRKTGSDVTGSLVTTTSTDDTLRFLTAWTFTGPLGIFELGVFNSTNIMLLRQVFVAVLNVVTADTLSLQIDIVGSDETVSTPTNVITHVGLAEVNKLIATDLGGARITAIALGTGTTAVAQANTTLATEITAGVNGLARTEAVSHTVILDTETVANDTVKVTSIWNVTATVAVTESGLFSTTTVSSGVMFIRYLFSAVLNLINTDQLTVIKRFVNK